MTNSADETEEAQRLFREAADLAIRLQNDPVNPVSADMIKTWVTRSPAHAAAWARVAAIHGMTGTLFTENRKIPEKSKLSRRNFIAGTTLGLGALTTGALTVPHLWLLSQADHITSTAEIRDIPLPDGSLATLGPDSAIAVDFSEQDRRIGLLSGMAYFQVQPDSTSPFTVSTGPMLVTALGTAFDVSAEKGFLSVAVAHGSVEARTGTVAGERLEAGTWLTFDSATSRITRGEQEPSQIAAWRSNMLFAENETVAALCAKISRWQNGRVLIADPSLGSRTVSGVFDLNDPDAAIAAVVRPFGAKTRKIASLLTIVSSV
ncbi:FecR domain-containing protein [Ochrobactrum sp. SFR4]|uniref:FecR family protein n=1 Tax=Ochrobactrum sp. SFR4 TaxID=2717368 RepID=UPI001C8C10A9|nr:FecR domain-containing protein [Ochrobactrum sp. SFR4]MBX8826605.1 DUF4880 domain-containing protein [Ochrobactrum sp. SFR4]